MPILNYTTTVNSIKTISEITQCLVEHDANKIVVDYNKNKQPVSLTFQISIQGGAPIAFSLPCRHTGVLKAMQNQKVPKKLLNEDQAIRVSWRIVKVWVEAQMAIVEAEIADMAEVFLPYAITKEGTTLYDQVKTDKKLFLTS